MQIPADPLDAAALEEALRPGQQQHRSLVEVDWGRTGLYDHALSNLTGADITVRVNRELDDSSPGSQFVVSGASSGQLSVIMEGELQVSGTPVAVTEVFAPYNPASPLYRVRLDGTPIRWTIRTLTSRGWILTRQFTGWIDKRGVRRAGNRVTITALDIPPALRDPASWPPWAVDGPAAARVRDYAPQRGLASSVVDHIVNSAGLRTRPRPPWESHTGTFALAYLPLCGSFAPSRGRQISMAPWGNFQLFPQVYPISPGLDPEDSYWTTGPFGLARDGEANRDPGSLIYTTSDIQPTWTGASTSITAWIYCGPTAPGFDDNPSSSIRPQVAAVHFGYAITTNYYAFRLSIGSDGKTLQIQVEPGTDRHYRATYTPPSDAWRHVHVQLDHSAGPVRAKLIVDGVERANFVPTGTGNSVAATALLNLWLPQVGVHLRPGVRMSDVMAWQETGAPIVVPERTVNVGATVDRSLNEISFVPRPGTSGWEDVKEIAAAEYATVLVAEDGHVYWHNRDTVRSTQDPQTITLASATDIGTTDAEAGRANAALVSARPGEASWQRAWEAEAVDTVVAPPGVTTWVFPTDDDVIAIESGTVPRLYQSAESASTLPVWSSKVNSGYVFVYDSTETEELLDQNMLNLTNQAGLADGQFLRLVVTNSTTSTGRFRLKASATAGTDPQPALRIAGLVLARPAVQSSTVVSQANIDADGVTRTLAIPGGDWHQHLPSVEASALFALRRATQPIPTFDRFQVPGDPRRQVSDRTVLELGVSGPRVLGHVAGITRTFDGKALLDDLIIRATHAPGRWALGDPVLGRLESTAVLG